MENKQIKKIEYIIGGIILKVIDYKKENNIIYINNKRRTK